MKILCPICRQEMYITCDTDNESWSAGCTNELCWVYETADFETLEQLNKALHPIGGIVAEQSELCKMTDRIKKVDN